MKNILKRNSIILSMLAAAVVALFVAIMLIPKGELHLMMNKYHCEWADMFFSSYTHIGEYGIYILAFCLLFYRAGSALFVLASELCTAVVVQVIKFSVNMPRPKTYFTMTNSLDLLPIVEGVNMHSWHSFPSGHTASFVILFLTASIILSNKKLHLSDAALCAIEVLFALLCMLGAYSRIYLSQHFAMDLCAGGAIAIVMTLLICWLFLFLEQRYPTFYDWHICLPKPQKDKAMQ